MIIYFFLLCNVKKNMGQSKPMKCIFCLWLCSDLTIDVPDFLDLSRLRATGKQAGEEELPDLMPPIVLPEDTRGVCVFVCMIQLGLPVLPFHLSFFHFICLHWTLANNLWCQHLALFHIYCLVSSGSFVSLRRMLPVTGAYESPCGPRAHLHTVVNTLRKNAQWHRYLLEAISVPSFLLLLKLKDAVSSEHLRFFCTHKAKHIFKLFAYAEHLSH